MGIFGWSYPPGCTGTPYDEDRPCEVCGEFEDRCICPPCPVCGEVGNPDCYWAAGPRFHEMDASYEQTMRLAENEAYWEDRQRSESRSYLEVNLDDYEGEGA